MLILARRKEQSIIVGEEVEIKIIEISRDKVRLGITAPKSIIVDRKEIHEAKQKGDINAKN